MPAITRADISGALKLLNANEIKDRKKHLHAMLLVNHPIKAVGKVLSDLSTYPEWAARMDLETVEPSPAESVAPPLARPRKPKPKKKGK